MPTIAHKAAPISFPSVKLDNIKPLKGHENYETWASQVSLILHAIGAKTLIIDNILPATMDDNTADELRQQTLLILIQLVCSAIMAQIAHLTDPHEIWVYLRNTYYPETYYSFVHQMDTFFSLKLTLDPTKPIANFVNKFEEEWTRLYQLASSGSSTSKQSTTMSERKASTI